MDSGSYFGSLRDTDYAGICCCMYSVQPDPPRMRTRIYGAEVRGSDSQMDGQTDAGPAETPGSAGHHMHGLSALTQSFS